LVPAGEKTIMNTMFRKYHEQLMQQLSYDLNCTPADFRAKEKY